jgi:hypothetical protein
MSADPLSYISRLLVSLSKQSGMGIVFAVVCGYGIIAVYRDLGESNRALLHLVREQIEESRNMTLALNRLSDTIDNFVRSK